MHTKKKGRALLQLGSVFLFVIAAVVFTSSNILPSHITLVQKKKTEVISPTCSYPLGHQAPSDPAIYALDAGLNSDVGSNRFYSMQQYTGRMTNAITDYPYGDVDWMIIDQRIQYAEINNTELVATCLSDNKELWNVKISNNSDINTPPVYDQNSFFFTETKKANGSINTIIAIDRNNGKERWSRNIDLPAGTVLDGKMSMAVQNGMLIVVQQYESETPDNMDKGNPLFLYQPSSISYRLFAFQTKNGQENWNHTYPQQAGMQMVKPVQTDTTLYLVLKPVGVNEKIVQIQCKDGATTWQAKMPASVDVTDIQSLNSRIFVQAAGSLYVLQATGEPVIWTYYTALAQAEYDYWKFTNDIAYHWWTDIDPQTLKQVIMLGAWRTSDGKKLWVVKSDQPFDELEAQGISGKDRNFFLPQLYPETNLLVVISEDSIEARIAVTGKKIWNYTIYRKLEASHLDHDTLINLEDTGQDSGQTTDQITATEEYTPVSFGTMLALPYNLFVLPEDRSPVINNSQVINVIFNSTTLYTLDLKDGKLWWTKTLISIEGEYKNNQSKFLPVPVPKSNIDFAAFVDKWINHNVLLNFSSDGRAQLYYRDYSQDSPDAIISVTIQFMGVSGSVATGRILSSSDGNNVGEVVNAEIEPNDILSLSAPLGIGLCGSKAPLDYCGA